MSEFKGKAGRIYTIEADDNAIDEGGKKWEVWLEDRYILGLGHTEMEALDDAGRNTIDILELIVQAKCQLVSTTAGTGD